MRLIHAFKAFFKVLKNPQAHAEHSAAKPMNTSDKKKDSAHLTFLSLLQSSGRFIDFIKEDISSYSDEQVGGVVRRMHEELSKSLEESVSIRPIYLEKEGDYVEVLASYDSTEIKMTGKVVGKGPYRGILRHKGWKAHKQSLPQKLNRDKESILCRAEVEVM